MSDISALAERIGMNVIARHIAERMGNQAEAVASLTAAIEGDVQLGVLSSVTPEELVRLRERG